MRRRLLDRTTRVSPPSKARRTRDALTNIQLAICTLVRAKARDVSALLTTDGIRPTHRVKVCATRQDERRLIDFLHFEPSPRVSTRTTQFVLVWLLSLQRRSRTENREVSKELYQDFSVYSKSGVALGLNGDLIWYRDCDTTSAGLVDLQLERLPSDKEIASFNRIDSSEPEIEKQAVVMKWQEWLVEIAVLLSTEPQYCVADVPIPRT